MTNIIKWTPEKRDRLNSILHHAIKDGADDDDVITFEGHELRISFAKYLLEYLDQRFMAKPSGNRRSQPTRKISR